MLTTVWIEPKPEQAEIDLGRFALWGFGHASGDGRSAEVEVDASEAMQRAMGDVLSARDRPDD